MMYEQEALVGQRSVFQGWITGLLKTNPQAESANNQEGVLMMRQGGPHEFSCMC